MTGRRDDSARDAIHAASLHLVQAWDGDDALPPVPVSPDCRDAAKHAACSGDSWDPVDDVPAACPCTCHPIPDGAA